MESIKPLKRFGQNYLQDQNILNKILDAIDPRPEDLIIEIGPGLGALTSKVLSRVNTLIAVEIDSRAAAFLRNKYPGLKIIEQDFLKFNLASVTLPGSQLRIIGNIPYNLTSSIIFKLFRNRSIVKDSVLMVQYEVAQRMTAVKGTKDYGILSVLLKYFSETRMLFKVSPNAFYPKPNVTSAVVQIHLRNRNSTPEEDEIFISVVKASFGNRRKKLKNSLSNSIFKDINFNECGIDLSLRAEQLEIEDFILLSEFVQKQNLIIQKPSG